MDHEKTGRPVTTPAPAPGREQVIGNGLAWLARWSGRWVLIALGAVLLGLLVRELWSILLPVLLAMIVATVLEGPARFLERRLRFPPALAAAGVLIGSIIVVVGVGAAIAPSVSGQTGDIADDAVAGLQKLQQWTEDTGLVTATQMDAAVAGAQDRLTSSADAIASGVLTGVGAVSSAAITLLLTLVLTFFFLKDGRNFGPWIGRLSGSRVGPHLREVMSRSWGTLGGYIRTQALVSFIDALFIGAALLLVGVPLAVPLTVLTFFGGFIPIVGAVVVGAIAVLVALVSNGVTGALIILAVILAVQQLEGNVLSPWLQSRSMQLHAVVVLLSVALGSTLFGIVGAFLAVPVVAVAAVILRYLDEEVTRAAVNRS
ncbi:AI-2E family transporter [Nocardioides pantholopis]|uniref:AI-2E family transporter n=1 Tax=Nocardioides pantholopis TaxID=2483798 RepID=UPI000FD6C3C9|nr:AI-2E family transporter [Nocardioides pantholopis]